MSFRPIDGALCGDGERAYYGYIQPANLTQPDKLFVEVMGGSVCFNRSSCEDTHLRQYMGIELLLRGSLFPVDPSLIPLLLGGHEFPLSELPNFGIRPGYLPYTADHPMAGRRGIYMVTCTGDIMLGRHNATYEAGYVAYHHGGMNLKRLLQGVRAALPDLKEIAVYGGSGGGVSSSVWMGEIAEMWPQSNITALVDSGFHLFPGSDAFAWFWNEVQWSAGPAGQHRGLIREASIPNFDWREKTAIIDTLHRYKGRVKVAYFGCDKDTIVFSERGLMGRFSSFNTSLINQLPDMWDFLGSLDKCAPRGTAYSYVMDCTAHHMTRVGFKNEYAITGTITPQQFVERFFGGGGLDPANASRTTFWNPGYLAFKDGSTCKPSITVSELEADAANPGAASATLATLGAAIALLSQTAHF